MLYKSRAQPEEFIRFFKSNTTTQQRKIASYDCIISWKYVLYFTTVSALSFPREEAEKVLESLFLLTVTMDSQYLKQQ